MALTDGARFDDPDQKRAYAAYLDAAVELDGPELATVAEAVRDHGVFTYLGVAERGTAASRGTVWCSLVALDPAAGIVSVHRKLVPTFEERLVWGPGDGHGLRTHRLGSWRVGGLNCWESWMPLARHALYADGEELHVGVWPGAERLTADITRFTAREGRVWCLAASGLIDPADVPAGFPFAEQLRGEAGAHDGGSCVAAPDGSWLVPPVLGEKRLVLADLDLGRVRAERQTFDPTGHYARPDVFGVTVDRRRRAAATFEG